MAEIVLTRYEADVKNYRKNVQDATKDTVDFDKATVKAGKDSTKAYDEAGNAAGDLSKQTDNLNKQSKSLGDRAKVLGARLVAAFAIQQVVARVTDTIIGFQKAMSELQAITGATGDDLDFLRERAIQLGKETTASAEEVVKGFQLIASAKPELLENAEALAFVTEQAIILADAAGFTLPEAAIALTDALNQFNEPAESAGKFINVLAAAAQQGSVLVPDLTTALSEFGAVARSGNVSIEQSAALIEVLGEKVRGASRVGIQLRNVLTILQGGADDTNPAIVGLNTALENLGKQQLGTTELTKQFGTENLIAAQILIENGTRIDELSEKITGTDTALQQAQINTDNFASAQIRAGNSIDSLILTLEDGTGPLSAFASELVNAFTDTVNQISGLNQEVNNMSDGFALATKLTNLFGVGVTDANNPLEKMRLLTLEVADATKDDLAAAIKLQTALFTQAAKTTGINSEETDKARQRLIELRDAYKTVTAPVEATTEAIEAQGEEVVKEIVSIGSLQKKLSELNTELKRAEIGSKEFRDIQAQIKTVSEQVAAATGKETEAAKKLREEREKTDKDSLKQLEESFKRFQELQKEDEKRFKAEQEAAVKIQALRAVTFEEQQAAIIAQRDLELANAQLTENERILIKEQANQKILDLNSDRIKQEEEDNNEQTEKDKERRQENFDAAVSTLNAIADFAGQLNQIRTDKELSELDKRRENALDNENLTEEERQAIEEQFEKQRSEILRKQAVKDKALAIFQATINGAAAVIAQLSVPGAGPALAIAAGVAAALQLAAIVATPIPEFHTGGVDIGNKDDEFTALLKRGESVITTDKTKMYRPELNAMMDGTLDEHIYNNYVLPQVAKIAMENKDNESKSFAGNMVNSMKLNATLSEGNMINQYLKKNYQELKKLNKLFDQPQPKKNYRHGG